MSNKFVYKPTRVPCPFCGYMIKAEDINQQSVTICPFCGNPIPPGGHKLQESNDNSIKA